jgi:hypothetical protein
MKSTPSFPMGPCLSLTYFPPHWVFRCSILSFACSMSKRTTKKRKRGEAHEPEPEPEPVRHYLAIGVYSQRPECDNLLPGFTIVAAPTYTSIYNYTSPRSVSTQAMRLRLARNMQRQDGDQQVSLVVLEITSEQADLVHAQEEANRGTMSYSLVPPAVHE